MMPWKKSVSVCVCVCECVCVCTVCIFCMFAMKCVHKRGWGGRGALLLVIVVKVIIKIN